MTFRPTPDRLGSPKQLLISILNLAAQRHLAAFLCPGGQHSKATNPTSRPSSHTLRFDPDRRYNRAACVFYAPCSGQLSSC
jgi:hypothetical protein